jgi:hypothetical protein
MGDDPMFKNRAFHISNYLPRLILFTAAFIFFAGLPDAWSKDRRAPELVRSIRDGEQKKTDRLIKRKKGINAPDAYGWAPLMYAVLNRDSDTVKKLLAAGADVNAQDLDGVSPLIASMLYAPQPFMIQYMPENEKQAADIPLLLIEHGADPDQADHDGNCPLIYATILDHAPVVEALLKKGADPDRADRYGRTALFFLDRRDMAASWAPESGAISSRRRIPFEQSDESHYSPDYAEKVALARKDATIQSDLIRIRIARSLREAGATEPDASKIQDPGRQRLDARPRRLFAAGPDDALTRIMLESRMRGIKIPEGRNHQIMVHVASDGTVQKALVISGLPKRISEKLQKAALKTRYQPAVKNGRPVDEWDTIIGGIRVFPRSSVDDRPPWRM